MFFKRRMKMSWWKDVADELKVKKKIVAEIIEEKLKQDIKNYHMEDIPFVYYYNTFDNAWTFKYESQADHITVMNNRTITFSINDFVTSYIEYYEDNNNINPERIYEILRTALEDKRKELDSKANKKQKIIDSFDAFIKKEKECKTYNAEGNNGNKDV